MEKSILFYDGHCALCNFFVRLVIRFEPKQLIYFAPIQSLEAKTILAKHPIDAAIDSIVFYEQGNCYVYHEAVFEILKHLNYPIKLILVFQYLPSVFNKTVYKIIAKNRFRFGTKLKSCPLPNPSIKYRFIGI